MNGRRALGMTLVELLISIVILSFIATAAAGLFTVCLRAHASGDERAELHREGLLALDRMTSGLRTCAYLIVPNGRAQTRDLLAFSSMDNDDNDFYFGDALFPRIDEDTGSSLTSSGYGILGVDEDGDGTADEGNKPDDDDEDGLEGEEVFNGIDDDNDGSIDEDAAADANHDAVPGIKGIDDDGDGSVDEMSNASFNLDDDEDGVKNEESVTALVYLWDSGLGTLKEIKADPATGILGTPRTVTLSTHVTHFQTYYDSPNAAHGPRVLISMTLTGDDGSTISFSEYAYPRNLLERTGKRVR